MDVGLLVALGGWLIGWLRLWPVPRLGSGDCEGLLSARSCSVIVPARK